MEVRKLTAKERFEANIISTVAFHMRMEDPEKTREESEKETVEDWGAFSEDGKIMARIINHRFEVEMDGQLIPSGGIGAVSTLPEYRNTGAVREIFGKLIPEAYRNGEVISTLYPFNHAFYRKFGYETVRWRNTALRKTSTCPSAGTTPGCWTSTSRASTTRTGSSATC